MQIKKAKYHLKRIETILNLHEDKLSPMDRDILLEDIRHLYETILFANDGPSADISPAKSGYIDTVAQVPKTQTDVNTEAPKNQPTSLAEKPFVDSKTKNDENIEKTTADSWSQQPEFATPEEPASTAATVAFEQPASGNESQYATSGNAPAHPTTPATPAENGSTGQLHDQDEDVLVQTETDYPELFNFTVSSDLSDRLGNTKIENLNRILTINDKILFINHLFGGEAIPFQESVKKFESFYTYDEARSYASRELVNTYQWTEEDKVDTVRQFMRQVKRLYN